ncbi:MAG: prepilin-type N-terminal cleavage/methylation domain-containing protein [Candidatus Omnitrophota bacterium]
MKKKKTLKIKGFTPLEIRGKLVRCLRSLTGFTLVEIMATVSVIALIIAFIAMPSFQKESRRAKATACNMNLKIVERVKVLWALREGKFSRDEPTWDDLVPEYLQKTPACPLGGKYDIGSISEKPTCSAEGHRLR